MIDDADREFMREMRDRLLHHEQELHHSYKIGIKRPKPKIDVLAFKVAIELDLKHTFGRILPELVKYRDEIRPDVRRYLIKCLRKQAITVQAPGSLWMIHLRDRADVSAVRLRARLCSQFWNQLADQLEQPRDVTPAAPLRIGAAQKPKSDN